MRVVITGGGGFLGQQLCQKLLVRGTLTSENGAEEAIEEIILFDAQFHQGVSQPTFSSTTPIRVEPIVGSVASAEAVRAAVGTQRSNTSIFHLASLVSGECEEHFDDALRVNLDGGRNVFEAARESGSQTRVVFASSIAGFGGDAMQEPCSDQAKLTPQTTYGMTKVLCELMLNDYTRKGFFDGRSARLPTVIIRPGKPNAAASSWHGWSPDGKTLAFCGQRDGTFGIFTVPAEGGRETRLTTARSLDDGPEYSPDGQYIYFNSDRTGRMQIWRMRSDGGAQEQVTSDEFNNWFPHPSPDGRHLVFLSYDEDVSGHPPNKDILLRLLSLGRENGVTQETQVLARAFGGQGTLNVPCWSADSKQIAFVTYQLVGEECLREHL